MLILIYLTILILLLYLAWTKPRCNREIYRIARRIQEVCQSDLVLIRARPENEVLDLQDVFKRFSFDCICRFSFGLDPNCLVLSLPVSKFAVSFDLDAKLLAGIAMTTSPYVWKMKRVSNLGSEKTLKEAINVIDILALEVILQKRKIGISGQNRDFLSRFMLTVNNDTCLRDRWN